MGSGTVTGGCELDEILRSQIEFLVQGQISLTGGTLILVLCCGFLGNISNLTILS